MTQKRKPKALKRINSELGNKIKAVRDSLGLSQGRFAIELEISRSQVVVWEQGAEAPSNDKLQKIASLSGVPLDLRLWFWRTAIPELEALKAAIREELQQRTSPASGQSVTVLDVYQRFVKDPNDPNGRKLLPVRYDWKTFEISTKSLAHPESSVCVVVSPASRFLGPLPEPLGASDLVIVDRSETDPKAFFDRAVNAKPRIAAVLFPSLPENIEINFTPAEAQRLMGAKADIDKIRRQIEVQSRFTPEQSRANEAANEDLWAAVERAMRKSTILYGWLGKQTAGVPAKLVGFKEEDPRWRLVLFLDSQRTNAVALTHWMADQGDFNIGAEPLLNGAEIFGAVISWISDPRKLDDHETTIPW